MRRPGRCNEIVYVYSGLFCYFPASVMLLCALTHISCDSYLLSKNTAL